MVFTDDFIQSVDEMISSYGLEGYLLEFAAGDFTNSHLEPAFLDFIRTRERLIKKMRDEGFDV